MSCVIPELLHNPLKAVFAMALAFGCSPASSGAASRPGGDPREIVAAAMAAQGGEARLRGIKSVAWEYSGYRNQLEESERPEGPYITEFNEGAELHDLANRRFRSSQSFAVYPAFRVPAQSIVVSEGVAMREAGGRRTAASAETVEFARERMALSPERILVTASDAPDLRRLPDVTLQSIRQRVVTFTLDGAPVTLYLNPYTGLPTAFDYSGPLARRGYWRYLGDATMRTWFGYWWLCKGGVRLPMQWNVEENGLPDGMTSVRKVVIDGAFDENALMIPADVRSSFDPVPHPDALERMTPVDPARPAVEVAPGVVLLPGPWNVALVRQDDGVVILEAPISSGYSAKVMVEAGRLFPGAPVKAVISTSDSWPHVAGLREYAARGVPIYALDLNLPVVRRILAEGRTALPDALSRHPRRATIRQIGGRVTIGTGQNRLEIMPLRGETSERQMMVYLAGRRLLYGSDPFQRDADGTYFIPETVSELVDAVNREHLSVDRFFMMHVGPTAWSDLPAVVAKAARVDTPDGRL